MGQLLQRGQYHTTDQGQPAGPYAYAGDTDQDSMGAGAGVYNSDRLRFLAADVEAGFDETPSGSQFNASLDLTTLRLAGGLRDAAELLGVDLGGGEDALEGEVHGPQARGAISLGPEGASLSAGCDLLGGKVKLGGAEYDGVGGQEVGLGLGVGVGAGFGLHWSDDDQDGLREVGAQGSGAVGPGFGFSTKNEIPASWLDWLMGGE